MVAGISNADIAILPAQIFGKNDNHVPPEGRDLIRKTLHEKGVLFSFYEVAWAQRESTHTTYLVLPIFCFLSMDRFSRTVT